MTTQLLVCCNYDELPVVTAFGFKLAQETDTVYCELHDEIFACCEHLGLHHDDDTRRQAFAPAFSQFVRDFTQQKAWLAEHMLDEVFQEECCIVGVVELNDAVFLRRALGHKTVFVHPGALTNACTSIRGAHIWLPQIGVENKLAAFRHEYKQLRLIGGSDALPERRATEVGSHPDGNESPRREGESS